MTEYRLVRFPALDRHLTVAFRLPDPADAHEAVLTLHASRAAWQAQGAPEELTVVLSAPVTG